MPTLTEEAPPVISKKLDKTSQAAIRYLTAEPDSDARLDAFIGLRNICRRVLNKNGLFLRDYTKAQRPAHRAGDAHIQKTTATEQWIEEFLLTCLAPYNGLSSEQIHTAAEADDFRYLGRLCRLRLIDELRKRDDGSDEAKVVGEDTAAFDDGQALTVLDTVGQQPENATQSSLGKPSAAREITAVLQRNQRDLEKLLGEKLFAVLEIQCLCLLNGDATKGEITAEVGKRLEVKARQATTYLQKLQTAISKAKDEGNPPVAELFDTLAASIAASRTIVEKPLRSAGALDEDDEPMEEGISGRESEVDKIE